MAEKPAGTFGDELKRLRGSRSAVEVAKAAGVSQAFLSRLETGDRAEIGLRAAVQLAAALGVEVGHFARYFQGEQPAPSPAPDKGKGKRK